MNDHCVACHHCLRFKSAKVYISSTRQLAEHCAIMNAPERSTSYVLEPGEPKISHAVDTRIRNAANFQINKEDHTIGNLLKADLLKNKRVLFAAYQHPHPLQNFINLKVQTDGTKAPLKELVATCKNLGTLIDVLDEEFDQKLKKYNEEKGAEAGNMYD